MRRAQRRPPLTHPRARGGRGTSKCKTTCRRGEHERVARVKSVWQCISVHLDILCGVHDAGKGCRMHAQRVRACWDHFPLWTRSIWQGGEHNESSTEPFRTLSSAQSEAIIYAVMWQCIRGRFHECKVTHAGVLYVVRWSTEVSGSYGRMLEHAPVCGDFL